MPECSKCSYKGLRNEFRYVGQAQEVGVLSVRRCPQCDNLVICDEMEEDRAVEGNNPWGISRLRGRVFSGKIRKERKVNEM